MLGKVDEAYRSFQEASSLDESKLESIAGMIECRLLQHDFDDAGQNNNRNSFMYYIT